jgi:nucleotide-binding universal stress UspA family protein
MKTIVVGFDGSPAAERALERSAALVGARGRVVIVTTSVSMPPAGVVDEPILDSPTPEEREALLESAASTLRSRGIRTGARGGRYGAC